MAIKARGELVDITDVVNLTVQFYNGFGLPANVIGFPSVSLVQPSGLVALLPTTAGVSQLDVGKYLYQFTAIFGTSYGVWNDVWQGNTATGVDTQTLSFLINHSNQPAINSDGYISLGDDPGFNFSQIAIQNINKILKALKARLNNSGKAKATDASGNVIYIDCAVFSDEMLITFICTALSEFNEVPYFTFFTYDDTDIISLVFNLLVEGATLSALASQALIERGREFQISDNGINFNPPSMAEMLNTQYNTLLTQHYDKLKYIKNSMRSSPLGLGSYSLTSGNNPAFRNLRHMRSRRIY